MIAVDTSSFVDYLKGINRKDTEIVDMALSQGQIVLPPVVLTELLSDPMLENKIIKLIREIPLLDITEGYWERSAKIRSILLKKKFKARLADTLITQSCLDHDVMLIARDDDYRHFAKYAGLKLMAGN